jgi:hypothetical protein
MKKRTKKLCPKPDCSLCAALRAAPAVRLPKELRPLAPEARP